MHFTVEQKAFFEAISHSVGIVENRVNSPILQNLLLQARKQEILITATDLDLTFISQFPAKVKTEGEVTVSVHLLYGALKGLGTDSELELEILENKQLSLRTGNANFSFNTLPAADFPKVEQETMPCTFALPASQVHQILDRTSVAILQDETRYYLNGVYLHQETLEDKKVVLRAVSTDGHRLALCQTPMPEHKGEMPSVILSSKTCKRLAALLDKKDEEKVQIHLSERQVRFVCQKTTLLSRLVDGSFPDYKRVIPKDNSNILEAEKKDFLRTVMRVSSITKDRSRALRLNLEKDKLICKGNSQEGDHAQDEIQIKYKGDPIAIGFNSGYLQELTQKIDTETMQIEIGEATSPALLRGKGEENFFFVLMPMRLYSS